MTEKEKAPQGCRERVVLEFISKGTSGPTTHAGTTSYQVEIHYENKKHLVKIPGELAKIIPTFSILKIVNHELP